MNLHIPAEPCSSCPYRRDTPLGVWDESEYRKLPLYDDLTLADYQAGKVPAAMTFLCHHSRLGEQEAVCRGWLAVHSDSIAVRLAVARGDIPPGAPFDQVESPLYDSGAQACEAGMAGIEFPNSKAVKLIGKIKARKK